jgi:hypothetical protein
MTVKRDKRLAEEALAQGKEEEAVAPVSVTGTEDDLEELDLWEDAEEDGGSAEKADEGEGKGEKETV